LSDKQGKYSDYILENIKGKTKKGILYVGIKLMRVNMDISEIVFEECNMPFM